MAVVIRMKRTGRTNRPCYRITVSDSRFPTDGRVIETLGLYDPIAPRPELRLTLETERARHWVSVGAQPSETVSSIFQREGVYEGRPQKQARDREGRKKKTATRTRRMAEDAARAQAKAGRRDQRKAAKKAAAAAAAAPAAAE